MLSLTITKGVDFRIDPHIRDGRTPIEWDKTKGIHIHITLDYKKDKYEIKIPLNSAEGITYKRNTKIISDIPKGIDFAIKAAPKNKKERILKYFFDSLKNYQYQPNEAENKKLENILNKVLGIDCDFNNSINTYKIFVTRLEEHALIQSYKDHLIISFLLFSLPGVSNSAQREWDRTIFEEYDDLGQCETKEDLKNKLGDISKNIPGIGERSVERTADGLWDSVFSPINRNDYSEKEQ